MQTTCYPILSSCFQRIVAEGEYPSEEQRQALAETNDVQIYIYNSRATVSPLHAADMRSVYDS